MVGAAAVCGRAVSAVGADGLAADECERQLLIGVTCKQSDRLGQYAVDPVD
jgi:hypothetical protein